jgi:hypothetical protein
LLEVIIGASNSGSLAEGSPMSDTFRPSAILKKSLRMLSQEPPQKDMIK